jgi:cytochrome P450
MEELRKIKLLELDFFRWLCGTVSGGLAEAVWGPRLLNESPDFVEAMRNLDESFLKLSYGFPYWMRRKETAHLRRMVDIFSRHYESGYLDGHPISSDRVEEAYGMGCTLEEVAVQNVFLSFALTTNMPVFTAWTAYWIIRDKDLLAKVRDEIEPAFKGGDIDLDYVKDQCPLLQSIWNEALRMCESAQSVRLAIEDTKVNDYDVPKGSMLVCMSR